MIHKTANVPAVPAFIAIFLVLTFIQSATGADKYQTVSIGLGALAFLFRAWVSTYMSSVMWRQRGTSSLAISTFRDTVVKAVVFYILAFIYVVAFMDEISIHTPISDLIVFRNVMRNIAISLLLVSVILGSRVMVDLHNYWEEVRASRKREAAWPLE